MRKKLPLNKNVKKKGYETGRLNNTIIVSPLQGFQNVFKFMWKHETQTEKR